MERETAILSLVRRRAQRLGYNQDMILVGEAIALRNLSSGASAHRCIQAGLDEASKMPAQFRQYLN